MPNQRHAKFTTTVVLAMTTCLVLLAAALPLQAGAQAPASVTLLAQRFTGVTTPGSSFDLVQSVVDFGSGARSAEITSTVPHYVSAIEGDLEADIDGEPRTIAAGKGIAVPAGARVVITNPNTAGSARAFVTSLLPVAAVASIHHVSGLGVTIFGTSRMTMSGGPASVDIVQSGARYDVGFKSGVHTMNQPHLMTHTEGVTGYTYLDGLAEAYRPPAQGQMYVGRAGYMHTVGSEKSSFLMTWVSAPGAPLTSAVTPTATPQSPAPAPPNTGSGVGPSNDTQWPGTAGAAVVAIVVAVLLLTGMSLRRRGAAR